MQAVPLGTLLPQVTSDSYFQALGVSAGPRFTDAAFDRLRFRLIGLKAGMQRSWTAGEVTILDYDQTGLRQEEATWIGIGFGPGFHQQNVVTSWFRIKARGSLGTVQDGQLLYDRPSNDRNTGFLYSVSVSAGLSFSRHVLLKSSREKEEMAGKSISRDAFQLFFSYQISEEFAFDTGYSSTEYTSVDQSQRVDALQFSVRFTPGAGTRY